MEYSVNTPGEPAKTTRGHKLKNTKTKNNRSYYMRVFLVALLGFSLVAALVFSSSVLFIAHLVGGGELFGVLNSRLFNEMIVHNSTDYLALVIGLPVTIFVSLIALSLAYLAYDTARSGEKRESQLVVKNKRDDALEAFFVTAHSVNRVVAFGSFVAQNLEVINKQFSQQADDIRVLSEVGTQGRNNERDIEDALSKNERERGQAFRKELLRLCDVLETDFLPSLAKAMSNPIFRKFLSSDCRIVFGVDRDDAYSILFDVVHTAKEYIGSLSDKKVVDVVLRHAKLSWGQETRVPGSIDFEYELYSTFVEPAFAGMLTVSSVMKPRFGKQVHDKTDSLDWLEKRGVEEPVIENINREIAWFPHDWQVRGDYYLGPVILAWLISQFPSRKVFEKELKAYFVGTVDEEFLDGIEVGVPPDEFFLKSVSGQHVKLSAAIGYNVTEDGEVHGLGPTEEMFERVDVERTLQSKAQMK